MQVLKADEIFDADDLKLTPIECPEWGEDSGVYVRPMDGAGRDLFNSRVFKYNIDTKKTDVDRRYETALLVVLTACDEDGELLFDNDEATVIEVSKKNARPLNRIATKAREISGLLDEDIEGLEKNSPPTRSEDS